MQINKVQYILPIILGGILMLSPSILLAQDAPSIKPVAQPVAQPVAKPVAQPVVKPVAQPVAQPAAQPAAVPAKVVKADEPTLLQRAKTAAKIAAEKTKAAAKIAAEKTKAAAKIAAEKTKAAAKIAAEKTKAAAKIAAEKSSSALKAAKEAGQKAVKSIRQKMAGDEKPSLQNLTKTQGVPAIAAKSVAPQVIFKTSHGNFVIELNPEKAPNTVKNFLGYVDSGYYGGTVFHRVISSFMIQGGGFTTEMTKKPTKAPIALESKVGLSNLRGTVAMARTNNPNSATSQFFVNVVNNRNLDSYGGGYAVFGKVVSGMETVDKIRAVRTTSRGGHRDVPVENVIIHSAERL